MASWKCLILCSLPTDIDECKMYDSGCKWGCENLPGGFRCTCPEGTVLADDKTSCQPCEFCFIRLLCFFLFLCLLLSPNQLIVSANFEKTNILINYGAHWVNGGFETLSENLYLLSATCLIIDYRTKQNYFLWLNLPAIRQNRLPSSHELW